MRHADGLHAEWVAIIGERELKEGSVTLKHLSDGSQDMVALGDVAARVR
jgi:histidyl-tRNA synthetase